MQGSAGCEMKVRASAGERRTTVLDGAGIHYGAPCVVRFHVDNAPPVAVRVAPNVSTYTLAGASDIELV